MSALKRMRNASSGMNGAPLRKVCLALGRGLASQGLRLAVAESCTGGLIAHLLTNVPGSSTWFVGGVAAYANATKARVLNVPTEMIAEYGAVSREVVMAMALGVNELLGTNVALAVSGIAGPGGGSLEKPVGTVWLAWTLGKGIRSEQALFSGTRLQIKKLAAQRALEGMLDLISGQSL